MGMEAILPLTAGSNRVGPLMMIGFHYNALMAPACHLANVTRLPAA